MAGCSALLLLIRHTYPHTLWQDAAVDRMYVLCALIRLPRRGTGVYPRQWSWKRDVRYGFAKGPATNAYFYSPLYLTTVPSVDQGEATYVFRTKTSRSFVSRNFVKFASTDIKNPSCPGTEVELTCGRSVAPIRDIFQQMYLTLET